MAAWTPRPWVKQLPGPLREFCSDPFRAEKEPYPSGAEAVSKRCRAMWGILVNNPKDFDRNDSRIRVMEKALWACADGAHVIAIGNAGNRPFILARGVCAGAREAAEAHPALFRALVDATAQKRVP